MTAETKAPARRLLATYLTQDDAEYAAEHTWRRIERKDADVQVEHRCKGTTPEWEWAVTAAKTGGGS